jgi:LL-diaminopimelate aminotransferase
MVKRNSNLAKLQSGYLFPEINRRKKELLQRVPEADIISLGIGNTTEPITPHVTAGLGQAAVGMGTVEGYSGYGDEQGFAELRARVAEKLYGGSVEAEEVFVSDGAKCDVGRMQLMFGGEVSVAVQDPSYPVYVDGSVIIGATGEFDPARGQFAGLEYMACRPENGFFPSIDQVPRTDLIYICSPNNPTGAVASHEQLGQIVAKARENRSIILFDAAYSEYIQDKSLPKSIFEIDGAREVALEINSFSKPAGFTGLRLGWTVVPKELAYDDGTPVAADWNRITTTVFNGASNVVQHGGLAALDDEGIAEMRQTVAFYMENARIIKNCLDKLGVVSHGGDNAPYIWAEFPGQDSWEVFARILEKAWVVTTPGAGFGPAGEGFVRFSAFGHREQVIEATERLENSKAL